MNELIETRFENRLLSDYLAALSSGTPAPGGGSAAALAGAVGCGLGSMVCNLTLAREYTDDVDDLRRTLLDIQSRLLRQGEADERVFTAYRDAIKLPKSTSEEKAARRDALENALVAAADVPLAQVTIGLEALAALRAAARVGTSHALGDLATGGYLVQAMMQGALENIESNTPLMKREENRAHFAQASHSAKIDLDAAMAELAEAIASR